jgi:putative aldouronate transport system permease protein
MKKKCFVQIFVPNFFLLLFAISCIVPFLIVVSISITDETIINQFGFSIIPRIISFKSYEMLFAAPKVIVNAYMITIIVTVVGTVLSMFVMIQFAYVLARRSYIFRKQLSFFLYFTMLFNGGLVPWYILITKYLSLKDNLWALILPMLVNAWNVFLLRTFFQGVPVSLIEAAKIDGASEYQVLYKIICPLSTGGIATVCIFTVLVYWNDWYNNMLFINDSRLYSLQYMLYNVMSRVQFLQLANAAGTSTSMQIPQESLRMATCVVAAGPMIMIFPFFQRYFVKGITIGSVKG